MEQNTERPLEDGDRAKIEELCALIKEEDIEGNSDPIPRIRDLLHGNQEFLELLQNRLV